MQPPQTLRRKVDSETYQDIASGTRSFTICLPDEDVQEGDFFVYVEMQEGKQGREIYRKVSCVVEHEGLVVAGLVPVEQGALEGLFAGGAIIVSYAVQKLEGNAAVVGRPAFLPPLAAPYVNPHQANDFLGVAVWPDGQYSIMLRCTFKDTDEGVRQGVNIDEVIVMVRVQRTIGEETMDQLIAVNHHFLMTGKLKDEFGNVVEPYFEEIVDYDGTTELTGDQQAEVDRIVEIADQEGM